MQKEFETIIDWDYPSNPSPWSKRQKLDFVERGNIIAIEIQEELGPDFEINNVVHMNVVI